MIRLRSQPDSVRGVREQTCRLAGVPVVATPPLDELVPFEVPRPSAEGGRWMPEPPRPGRLFAGRGAVGGRLRQVQCEATPDGYRVRVENAGEWLVDGEGCRALRTDGTTAEDRAGVLLGPGLILSLALQNVFCLHASAVFRRVPGPHPDASPTVCAFLGDSGAGKSTLARELSRATDGLFHRGADDVLPMDSVGRVRPRFPQLKLGTDDQPVGPDVPEAIPLSAIYVLDRDADPETEVRLEGLSPRETAQALLAHTVAARLFAPNLLARHLNVATRWARSLPGARLLYPRTPEALPRVARLLDLQKAAA